MTKKLVITADDFGLSKKINEGIELSYRQGIVTASSLLINAPATEDAIKRSRLIPGLQIGLHLGIVEGLCLSGNPSIASKKNYFGNQKKCLPNDWREFFASQILSRRFNKEAWTQEFKLQIELFLEHYKSVPFLNSTQHLHLLPVFASIIENLCQKYSISYVRTGRKLIYNNLFSSRPLQSTGIRFFSAIYPRKLLSPDALLGVDCAGRINSEVLLKLLRKVPEGLSELIVHPGCNDENLKRQVSSLYKNFDWEEEAKALTSIEAMDTLSEQNILRVRFP